MALLRYLKEPDARNRQELQTVLNEHRSPLHFALFLAARLPGGLWTLLRKAMKHY